MNDSFSRRGFLQLALGAGAGLCVPSIASAWDEIALQSRVAFVEGRARLTLDVFFRHDQTRAIALPEHAIRLDGRLTVGGEVHALELHKPPPRRMVTRSGSFRGPVAVIVPPGREQLYGRFSGEWPAGLARAQSGMLEVQAALLVARAQHPEERWPLLDALVRVRERTRVTLPA